MPARSEYAVAIICALTRERTAVEAMLDERHDQHYAIRGDNNSYTFGRMAQHNVVIASLGATYGTVPAAGVLRDIKRSLHTRYCLMVGIAGAMPRPDTEDGDIRLGDIVVGSGTPAVINYRLGKKIRDGFDIRSELSCPPDVLLKAVKALSTQHQLTGPTYLKHLHMMFEKHRRFSRPEISEDYYDRPDALDVLHETVPDGRGVQQSTQREPRVIYRCHRELRHPPDGLPDVRFVHRHGESVDYPKVFYGTIASADTLVKSAIDRDQTYREVKRQKKVDILCFEMEAAGIAEHCLVIRGICDYCDEYKNDDWQNFASATAAAYCKDLLVRLAAEEPMSGSTVLVGTTTTRAEQATNLTMAHPHSRDILHDLLSLLTHRGPTTATLTTAMSDLVRTGLADINLAQTTAQDQPWHEAVLRAMLNQAVVRDSLRAEGGLGQQGMSVSSILRISSDQTLLSPKDVLDNRLRLSRQGSPQIRANLQTLAKSRHLKRFSGDDGTTALIIQGFGQFRNEINLLGTEMVRHLQNCNIPVLWVLQPSKSSKQKLNLSWTQILQYLANQALEIKTQSTDQSASLQGFHATRAPVTEQDWQAVFLNALTGVPQAYVFIDMGVVENALLEPANVATLIAGLDRLIRGAQEHAGVSLKIVILKSSRLIKLPPEMAPAMAVTKVLQKRAGTTRDAGRMSKAFRFVENSHRRR